MRAHPLFSRDTILYNTSNARSTSFLFVCGISAYRVRVERNEIYVNICTIEHNRWNYSARHPAKPFIEST